MSGIGSTISGIIPSINATQQNEGWASASSMDVLGMANEVVLKASELSVALTNLKKWMNPSTDSSLIASINSALVCC